MSDVLAEQPTPWWGPVAFVLMAAFILGFSWWMFRAAQRTADTSIRRQRYLAAAIGAGSTLGY